MQLFTPKSKSIEAVCWDVNGPSSNSQTFWEHNSKLSFFVEKKSKYTGGGANNIWFWESFLKSENQLLKNSLQPFAL